MKPIRHAMPVAVVTAAFLTGCVSNNPEIVTSANPAPKYHTLPWTKVEVLADARPSAEIKSRAFWIDPEPMPSLAKTARDALAQAGYKLVQRKEEAEVTLRFDGYYRVLSGDRRRQGNMRLDEFARGAEVRWEADPTEPGVARRTLSAVTDNAGKITSPAHFLVAVTLGAAFEGIASATGVREAISSRSAGVGSTPLFCSTEEVCERANLQARYGYQQFVLALDRIDRDGKERATVRVEGISDGMIPDRLLSEAAGRLLAMYTTP